MIIANSQRKIVRIPGYNNLIYFRLIKIVGRLNKKGLDFIRPNFTNEVMCDREEVAFVHRPC